MEMVAKEMDEEEEVWSWGAGTSGQLGNGLFLDSLLPSPLSLLSSPLSLSCGGAHAVAVNRNGDVITWGRGRVGQLGNGEQNNLSKPSLVRAFCGHKVFNVSAGWNHTAFVTDKGDLFTCGDGGFGQLGHGNFDSVFTPVKVAALGSLQISMVACGMRHTLALSRSEGSVFAFGSSKRGQLGICLVQQKQKTSVMFTDTTRINLPCRIETLDQCGAISIYANGDHSAALTGGGNLYLWGRGYYRNSDMITPNRVFGQAQFHQVSLGWNHGLALTGDGKVFTWGERKTKDQARPQSGAVTLDPNISLAKPTQMTEPSKVTTDFLVESENAHGSIPVNGMECGKTSETSSPGQANAFAQDPKPLNLYEVPGLKNVKAIGVAAGAEHSAVALDDGTIKTWGWGEHGQLGLGDTNDQHLPQTVHIASGWSEYRSQVFCGSGFTLACLHKL